MQCGAIRRRKFFTFASDRESNCHWQLNESQRFSIDMSIAHRVLEYSNTVIIFAHLTAVSILIIIISLYLVNVRIQLKKKDVLICTAVLYHSSTIIIIIDIDNNNPG